MFKRNSDADTKRLQKLDAVKKLEQALSSLTIGESYVLGTPIDLTGYPEPKHGFHYLITEVETGSMLCGLFPKGDEIGKLHLPACAVWQLEKLTNHINGELNQ